MEYEKVNAKLKLDIPIEHQPVESIQRVESNRTENVSFLGRQEFSSTNQGYSESEEFYVSESKKMPLYYIVEWLTIVSYFLTIGFVGSIGGWIIMNPPSSSFVPPWQTILVPPSSNSLSWVKKYSSNVWLGKGNNEELLKGEIRYPLNDGDYVKTDQEGEGRLYIGDCLTIYLFQEGRLQKSSTSKANLKSGNVTSLIAGTSIFKNKCASKVYIRTNRAEIRLNGTWVVVTHLPNQQDTVVMVLEGSTTIQSLPISSNTTVSAITNVAQGNFWFTTGRQSIQISGLSAGIPYSLERLPEVATQLNIWKWLPRIYRQANQDNVQFPKELAISCTVETPTPDSIWNLRNIPVEGTVIGEVSNGQSFTAMGRNIDSKWIFGATSNSAQPGWVSRNALSGCAMSLDQLPMISTVPSAPPPPQPITPTSYDRPCRRFRPRPCLPELPRKGEGFYSR